MKRALLPAPRAFGWLRSLAPGSIAILWGSLAFGVPLEAQRIVAGPASSFTPGSAGWSWDGGDKTEDFRAALEDPANFGPNGVVPNSITTVALATIDATTLADVDVFVAPWWEDDDTPPAAAGAIVDYFLNGGSLVVYQDDPDHDLLGESLGIPTLQVEADGSPSSGPPPIFDGAFGTAGAVLGFGNKGQLPKPSINSLNGTPIAVNASDQITAALWLPGQYAPGAGMLLIVADVDTMATTQASYTPLNDNGIFSLNAIHLLAFEGVGSVALFGCGFNPPGSLVVKSGTPNLGTKLVLGVDNPFGTQGPGSLTYVYLSSTPHPNYPCGGALPGAGMAFPGQSGELLLQLVPPNPLAILLGDPWNAAGQPADVPLSIPFNPAFAQLEIFGQGVIVDPLVSFGIGPALTEGVQIQIGVGP